MSALLQTQVDTKPRRAFMPVQTGLLQRQCACGGSSQLTGECSACRKKGVTLQRRATHESATSEVPRIVYEVLRSPGQPLDSQTQAFFGSRYGHNFSHVRVHDDARSHAAARAVHAKAYTVGHDVVFGAGQYAPGTNEGKQLLAHELVHVVQQFGSSGTAQPLRIGAADSSFERIAEQTATHLGEDGRLEEVGSDPGSIGQVQRDLATPPPAVAPPRRPDLTAAQIRTAIAFNRTRYTEEQTRLIQDIIGTEPTGTWVEDDIRAIADIQEEYNLVKDGIIGAQMFRFLDEELRREGLPTDDAHCITSFFVLGFPVTFTDLGGGQHDLRGRFRVQAQFPQRCNCADFQYRQFIRGHFNLTRAGVVHDLTGIFNLLPAGRLTADFREDGDTSDVPVNYGHRDQPADNAPEDHYIDDAGNDDQANGCRYRSEDLPGATLNTQAGDAYDVAMEFRGEIQRGGRVIRTLHWAAIRGIFRVP